MIANNYHKNKLYYQILSVVLAILFIIPVFGKFNTAKAASPGISIVQDSFEFGYIDAGSIASFIPLFDVSLLASILSLAANSGDVAYTTCSANNISGAMSGPCGVPLVFQVYDFTVSVDDTYRVAVNSYAEAAGKFAYVIFDVTDGNPVRVVSNGTNFTEQIDTFRHGADVEFLADHTYAFLQFYFRFALFPGQRITFSLTNSIAPVVDDVPDKDVSNSPYLVLNNIDSNGVITWDIYGVNSATPVDNYCTATRNYTDNVISHIVTVPNGVISAYTNCYDIINFNKITSPIRGGYYVVFNIKNLYGLYDGNYIESRPFTTPLEPTDGGSSGGEHSNLLDVNTHVWERIYVTGDYPNEVPVKYNCIENQPLLLRTNALRNFKSFGLGICKLVGNSTWEYDSSWQVKCVPYSTTNNIYQIYNISYDSTSSTYSTYNYGGDTYYEELHYTTTEEGDTYYVTDNSGQQIDCDSITIIQEGDTYNITYNYITNGGGSGGDDGGDGDDGGLLNWIKERILNALGSIFDEVTDFLASILGDLLNLIWKIIKGFLGIFTDILADAPAKIDDFFGAFNPNSESNIFDFWNITDLEPNYTPGGE